VWLPPRVFIKPDMLVRLFIHESRRVYSDRLVSESEIEAFESFFAHIMKKTMSSLVSNDHLFDEPIVYTNFVTTTDGSYLPIPSIEKLKSVLDQNLMNITRTTP